MLTAFWTGLFLGLVAAGYVGYMDVNRNGKAYKKIEEKIERAHRKDPEFESWFLHKQLVKKLQVQRMVITFLVVFSIGMVGSYLSLIDLDKSFEEDPPSARLP